MYVQKCTKIRLKLFLYYFNLSFSTMILGKLKEFLVNLSTAKSLFRNKSFMLDEMLKQKASKFWHTSWD